MKNLCLLFMFLGMTSCRKANVIPFDYVGVYQFGGTVSFVEGNVGYPGIPQGIENVTGTVLITSPANYSPSKSFAIYESSTNSAVNNQYTGTQASNEKLTLSGNDIVYKNRSAISGTIQNLSDKEIVITHVSSYTANGYFGSKTVTVHAVKQ